MQGPALTGSLPPAPGFQHSASLMAGTRLIMFSYPNSPTRTLSGTLEFLSPPLQTTTAPPQRVPPRGSGSNPKESQVTSPAAFWLVSIFSKSPGGPIPEQSTLPRAGRSEAQVDPFPCVPPMPTALPSLSPQWPPCFFLERSGMAPPQGLSTCCSPSPQVRSPNSHKPHFLASLKSYSKSPTERAVLERPLQNSTATPISPALPTSLTLP